MVRDIKDKHLLYYEAILQLRDVSQEVVDFSMKEIIKNKIHIAKKIKLKNGYDIYLADNNFTKGLGKKLQRFGGKTLMTASIFGRKKGKEIFRVTVLFRQSPFKKGDVIEYQGEKYEVILILKDVLLKEAKTGKKIHIPLGEMSKTKLFTEQAD